MAIQTKPAAEAGEIIAFVKGVQEPSVCWRCVKFWTGFWEQSFATDPLESKVLFPFYQMRTMPT